MKQSGGRDGDGDNGVHRRRAQDAAGGGRGPLRENSRGGDAAPTSRASTGLPPRAPPGRPPRALPGPHVLERHRDADQFPRECDAMNLEEEPTALSVRPRGAPRERPEEGGDSATASREMGQRSTAPAPGGRARRGRHHDSVDYLREDESPSWEAGAFTVRPHDAPRERPEGGGDSAFRAEDQRPATTALGGRACRGGRHHDDAVCYTRGDESPSWEAEALVVRPCGARRERPEGGGASEAGAAEERSPATALGGRAPRGGRHHDSVGYTRGDEFPSWEAGALVVRPRGARREYPEGAWTSNPSAAAKADLGRHHGGLVSPREREPRRVEGTPRGHLQDRLCDGQRIRPEGSLRAAGKLWGSDANGDVSDDVPQNHRGVTSPLPRDSGKGQDADAHRHAVASASRDRPPRRTPALSGTDARGGGKISTAAAVHDETGAETAPNPCSSEPDSSSAAASGHPHPAQGQANLQHPVMIQSRVTGLLENKGILDVDFLENWLLEKERQSSMTYFETYASPDVCIWYNKWASCLPEYISPTAVFPQKNAIWNSYCCDEIPRKDLGDIFLKIQVQNYKKCDMKDLMKGSCRAMYSLQEFLCRSCLDPKPNLELSALSIILAAANSKSNLQILGAKIRIIGIAVVKAFIGSPKVQNEALKLLSKLCGLHENTKRILDFGGFCGAIHVLKFSALGAEPAAQLVSTLLESEYSYPSIFKDNLPYHLVRAVGLGRVKEASIIEDILVVASQVELAQIRFFEALMILESGSRSKNLLLGILSRIASAQIDED